MTSSPSRSDNKAAASPKRATSRAMQSAPLSYTYGSPGVHSNTLEYEPPARTWARERAAGTRQRSGSAVAASTTGTAASVIADTEDEVDDATQAEGDVTNLAAHGPGAWNGGTSPSPDKRQRQSHKPTLGDTRKTVQMQQAGINRPKASTTSILQQSARPDASNLKDTSVNIATAFRQAATTTSSNNIASAANSAGVGFLSRAGDRNVVQKQQDNDENELDTGDYDNSNESFDVPEGSKETQHPASTATSSKKRKKPSGDRYKGYKDKDPAFKVSKKELNVEESDDSLQQDQDSDVDVEELRAEYGITSTLSANGTPHKGKTVEGKQPKKKARKEGGGEQDSGAEVASSKAAAKKRRKSGQKDGAYRPGQETESENDDDFDEVDEAGKKRKTNGRKTDYKGKSRASRDASANPSLADNHGDTASISADGDYQAQSTSTKQGMTSFYLQAPADSEEPEFKTQEQARLTQVHPKSGNNGTTYQPYFAFSTTTIGTGPGRRSTTGHGHSNSLSHSTTTATLSRARRESSVPTSQAGSTSQDPVVGGDTSLGVNGNTTRETGPSSNASFDQRGSEYDYAEEERMTNALLAARQAGQTGRSIPEGRPNTLLGGLQEYSIIGGRDRSLSLPLSEQSMENIQQQPQRRLGPRRAPPPPGPSNLRRSPSLLSETPDHASQLGSAAETEAAQALNPRQQRSISRKLGEIVRSVFLVLYWLTIGPVKALIHADWNKLWKWAAVMAFIGLMLGSMNERADSHPSRSQRSSLRYYLPFLSSPASPKSNFDAPSTLPSNFDELITRLANLESSFSTLSQAQTSDRSLVDDQVRSLGDSARRLSLLEGEFESEKRRMTKNYDGLVKNGQKETEKLDIGLKGVKTQLDYLNNKLKTLGNEKKQDTLELAKMKSDLSGIDKIIDGLDKRMSGLSERIEESRMDEGEIARIVAKRIEDVLPARMAVSIDSKSGQVQIDPKFWQYLKNAFPAGNGQEQTVSGPAPRWEDFLASNQASLRKMIGDNVDERVSKGAVLSRRSFTEILEKELTGLRGEMSKKTLDDLSKLTAEVNGKLAKVTSTSSTQTGKQQKQHSIKLSSGEELDQIVNSLIDSALSKYSKDILARPDFALYSSGGRVIPSLTSPTYEIRPSTSIFSPASLLARMTGMGVIRGKAPVTALHPDISVGQCWPFSGSKGQLGIMLSRKILPSEITIEHASKEVALDVTSAPKNFELWGLVEDIAGLEKLALMAAENSSTEEGGTTQMESTTSLRKAAPPNRLLLVKGEYDVQAENNIQSFPVAQEIQDLGIPVHVVLLRILDNHGNEALSCLYRVRVGGTLVDEEVMQ